MPGSSARPSTATGSAGRGRLMDQATSVSPANYTQPVNLKETMRVFQLKEPLDGMYSVVYQNVQPSTGSTLMLL